jgi:hypothetical protein
MPCTPGMRPAWSATQCREIAIVGTLVTAAGEIPCQNYNHEGSLGGFATRGLGGTRIDWP